MLDSILQQAFLFSLLKDLSFKVDMHVKPVKQLNNAPNLVLNLDHNGLNSECNGLKSELNG